MRKARIKLSARERILETAERLFYADGVRAVGIDTIIREAGVAKMTLYNHFPSKDDLILEVLKHREEKVVEMFRVSIERHSRGGKDRLEAFFAALNDWFRSKDFRGCAFINASVELADPSHPAAQFAAKHKRSFREMLTGIITEVAGANAALVAPAVCVLVEGAIVTAVIEGNPDAADIARDAALSLVATTRKS